jgi:hypothetical protein
LIIKYKLPSNIEVRAGVIRVQEIRRFLDWNFLLVTYLEPFAVEDMFSAAASFEKSASTESQVRCVLIDLRKVAIRDLAGADSRRFASFRKDRADGQSAEPAVFLIRSMEDYPYIRMHNQWVDAAGLRREMDTLITTDVHEALLWIEGQTGKAGLANALAQVIPG